MLTRQRLHEIVANIVESGFGARQNDWASHQQFAEDLLAELEKEHFNSHRTLFIELPFIK